MNTRCCPTCRSSKRSPRTSQRRSPPSTIASTIALSRCAQRSEQRIHLARHENARQGAGRAHQRITLPAMPFPPGRQTPRHRIARDITPSVQVCEQPPHARQTTPHRPRRHTISTTGQLQPAVTTMTLRGDEPEHVSAGHLCRVLTDHGKEDLQVVGRSQHRVRSAATRDEVQIGIHHRDAQPQPQAPGRVNRPNQALDRQPPRRPSISTDDRPPAEMSMKITHISSTIGWFLPATVVTSRNLVGATPTDVADHPAERCNHGSRPASRISAMKKCRGTETEARCRRVRQAPKPQVSRDQHVTKRGTLQRDCRFRGFCVSFHDHLLVGCQ
jgi:hypothetical protein